MKKSHVPRFTPVTEPERDCLEVHISILSPTETMTVSSEKDLLAQVRPGLDGLVLEDGPYHGTFLPAVWETLPDPGVFLAQLKRKAGMPPDYWSDTITVLRYAVESVQDKR